MPIKESQWPSSLPMDRSAGRPEPIHRENPASNDKTSPEKAIEIIQKRIDQGQTRRR